MACDGNSGRLSDEAESVRVDAVICSRAVQERLLAVMCPNWSRSGQSSTKPACPFLPSVVTTVLRRGPALGKARRTARMPAVGLASNAAHDLAGALTTAEPGRGARPAGSAKLAET